jgi:hypothetical protein
MMGDADEQRQRWLLPWPLDPGPRPGARELIAVVRQEKPGVSCRVEVPVGQGLTSHPYRALRLLRRRERKEEAAEQGR